MRTLGIDLSAQPKKTAACRIEWQAGRVAIDVIPPPLADRHLLELIGECDWTGIDAPFGWPAPFAEAVSAWHARDPWPEDGRDPMRLRATDRLVRSESERIPLSVSSDRIAVCAMRCAWLLTELAGVRGGGPIDRTGEDRVVEVYPGGALPLWSGGTPELLLDPRRYKGGSEEAGEKREALVSALECSAPWLRLDDGVRTTCLASDDVLDALLCALIARAAARGRTLWPEPGEQKELAAVEGWIHLPRRGSLAELAG